MNNDLMKKKLYRFILYYSFTGANSVSLRVTSLLYVHGFIMMSPLFKDIFFKFAPQIICLHINISALKELALTNEVSMFKLTMKEHFESN